MNGMPFKSKYPNNLELSTENLPLNHATTKHARICCSCTPHSAALSYINLSNAFDPKKSGTRIKLDFLF